MTLKSLLIVTGLLLGLVPNAFAGDIFILATGRRDPRIFAIDFKEALRAKNNNTPNAIVARSKTPSAIWPASSSTRTARAPSSSTTTARSTTPSSCSTGGAATSP